MALHYRWGRPKFVAESYREKPQISRDQTAEQKKQEDRRVHMMNVIERKLKEPAPCAETSTLS